MKRVSVDTETTGISAGCPILSIGAVEFDTETGTLGEQFYCVINHESCLAKGLRPNEETIAWWAQRSEEARQVLNQASEPVSESVLTITDALTKFNEYLSQFGKDVEVWGNGSDYDNVILDAAYKATGVPRFWEFWNNRCYRTLKNLFPEVKFVRQGMYHHALHDAISQANHALDIFKQINVTKRSAKR